MVNLSSKRPSMARPLSAPKSIARKAGGLAIQRPEIGAGAVICAGEVARAKGAPRAGAKDVLFGNVVHTDRDAQDGGQAEQVCADVAVTKRAVVCAPVCHHGVHISEGAASS